MTTQITIKNGDHDGAFYYPEIDRLITIDNTNIGENFPTNIHENYVSIFSNSSRRLFERVGKRRFDFSSSPVYYQQCLPHRLKHYGFDFRINRIPDPIGDGGTCTVKLSSYGETARFMVLFSDLIY